MDVSRREAVEVQGVKDDRRAKETVQSFHGWQWRFRGIGDRQILNFQQNGFADSKSLGTVGFCPEAQNMSCDAMLPLA